MNGVAGPHAYKFTHFNISGTGKTSEAKHLSPAGKIRTLIMGVDNPRPFAATKPTRPFTTLRIHSNKMLECWYMEADQPQDAYQVRLWEALPIFPEPGYQRRLGCLELSTFTAITFLGTQRY